MTPSAAFKVIVFVIAAMVLSWRAVAERRVALVIGNGAYPSSLLSSPKKDEQAVAKKLKALGFAVTERFDLKRDELLTVIRDFGEQLSQQKDAIALFYYSGHGMSVNNRNYIIPIDANISSEADVELHAVPVENVLMRMTASQDKANILILDACRDNPFEKRWKSFSGGLAPIYDEPTGTLIAYAAAPGHVAEAGLQGSLSKYTEALVTLIDQPDISLIATFQNIQNAVYRSTQGRQQPYLEISPGLPEFYFKALPVAAVPPAPPAATSQPTPVEPAVVAVSPAPALEALKSLPVQLSARDLERFGAFDQNRAAAIAEVKAKPTESSQEDLNDLRAVLTGNEMPMTAKDIIGNWRCRTLKLGGIGEGVVIYDFFKCIIFMQQNALILQKTTGSQRTRGNLYRLSDTRYVYVGAGTINDEPPISYGTKPHEDEVAYLVRTGTNRLRLEFPAPYYESVFDIMDLRR